MWRKISRATYNRAHKLGLGALVEYMDGDRGEESYRGLCDIKAVLDTITEPLTEAMAQRVLNAYLNSRRGSDAKEVLLEAIKAEQVQGKRT